MTIVFRNAEGEEVELTGDDLPEGIDPSVIPASLVRQHPDYNKLLDESIDRRKELRELKDRLTATPSEQTSTEQPSDEPAPTPDKPEPPQTIDVEALRKEIAQQVLGQIQEAQAQQSEAEKRYSEIVQEYRLNQDAQNILGTARQGMGNQPDMDVLRSLAETLSRTQTFVDTGGVENDNSATADLLSNLDKRMFPHLNE